MYYYYLSLLAYKDQEFLNSKDGYRKQLITYKPQETDWESSLILQKGVRNCKMTLTQTPNNAADFNLELTAHASLKGLCHAIFSNSVTHKLNLKYIETTK